MDWTQDRPYFLLLQTFIFLTLVQNVKYIISRLSKMKRERETAAPTIYSTWKLPSVVAVLLTNRPPIDPGNCWVIVKILKGYISNNNQL